MSTTKDLPHVSEVEGASSTTNPKSGPRRRELSVEEFVHGIRTFDCAVLARAITLVESNASAHQEMAQEVL